MLWGEVDKAGGSSLATAECIDNFTGIIIHRATKNPLVVVSAFGKPRGTDLTKATDLLKNIEAACYKGDFETVTALREEFRNRASDIIRGLGLESIIGDPDINYWQGKTWIDVNLPVNGNLIQKLQNIELITSIASHPLPPYTYSAQTESNWVLGRLDELISIYTALRKDPHLFSQLSERTTRDYLKDQFMALGELLTSGLVAATFIKKGYPAKAVDPADMGLITDDNYQNADLLPNTLERMRNSWHNLQLKNPGLNWIPTVAGYVGKTAHGIRTTLGRGASDATAAFEGYSIKASILIWTDVDGLKDGTPGIIAKPKTLEDISYDEGRELAYHGATAIHPRAVETAKAGGRKLYILNSFNPDGPFTTITSQRRETGVKAITVLPKVSIIDDSISWQDLGRFLEYLSGEGVNVPLMSYTNGKAEIVIEMQDLSAGVIEAFRQLTGRTPHYSKNKYLLKL